jgi:hypothetical protein
MGSCRNVSKEYLHRYLWQWDFCWNTRDMNDEGRTGAASLVPSNHLKSGDSKKRRAPRKPLLIALPGDLP